MDYIVVRCPNPYLGKPISIVYYVVNRHQLNKCIEDYFNNKYKHTEEYAPIQVFKKLVAGKQGRTYKDAVRHCRYLNGQINKYKDESIKTKSRAMETKGRSVPCSSMC